MEVTTVSPSPISPTEGDDLCEIDVTNVAVDSVTLLICLCGLLGNGAVLCLLSLEDRNFGIYDLAFADFLFLLFTVPASILFLVEELSCSPVMPPLYLSFLFHLSVVSFYWALYRLTRFNSVMIIFNPCVLYCRRDLPDRLGWLLYSAQYWIFFALFTVIPAVTNLCPSQQQEQCRTALISMYALILLLCVVPDVISRAIDFIKAKWGSKKLKLNRRDIIVFLILIFILLLSLCNFLQQLGYIFLSSEVLVLLNCIQSSIKPFIYFLAGRCWRPCSWRSLRLSLQRVFDEQKEKAAHTNDASMDTRV